MRKSSFKRGFVYIVHQKSTGMFYCGQQSRFYSQGLEPDEIMGKLYFTSCKKLAEAWKANPDDFEWGVSISEVTDKRELDFAEASAIMSMWRMKVPCYNKVVKLILAKRKTDEPESIRKCNDFKFFVEYMIERMRKGGGNVR